MSKDSQEWGTAVISLARSDPHEPDIRRPSQNRKAVIFRLIFGLVFVVSLVLMCSQGAVIADDGKKGDANSEKGQKSKAGEEYVNSYEQLRRFEIESRHLELQIALSSLSLAGSNSPGVQAAPLVLSQSLDTKRKEIQGEIAFHKKRLFFLRQSLQHTELLKKIEKELGLIQ